MADKIEGPLGLWPFPILNTLITIVKIREEEEVVFVRASQLDEDTRGEIEVFNE